MRFPAAPSRANWRGHTLHSGPQHCENLFGITCGNSSHIWEVFAYIGRLPICGPLALGVLPIYGIGSAPNANRSTPNVIGSAPSDIGIAPNAIGIRIKTCIQRNICPLKSYICFLVSSFHGRWTRLGNHMITKCVRHVQVIYRKPH